MSIIQERQLVGSHLQGSLLSETATSSEALQACAAVASAIINQLGDDDLAVQQRGLSGDRPRLSPAEWSSRKEVLFKLAGRLGIGPIIEELHVKPFPEKGSAREANAPKEYELLDAAKMMAVLATVDDQDVVVDYQGSRLDTFPGELPKDIVNYANNHEIF